MHAIAASTNPNRLFSEEVLDLAALVRNTVAEAKVTILDSRRSNLQQNDAKQNEKTKTYLDRPNQSDA